ncbi:hypothetical protein L202_01675 [Cryptococcus amylolentus CBS 6039]|uniref:Uncharacterized protein n=1 Tax=Cryptococcus amylolentus CBS 6039 TaxID=1295533 RepID=A0A1E3I4I9_9TREE|nr:hypothetical protein L202_01675 [Cryptococcus amylolentus CBS 6039]ODN83554.1 hypothetical protein L202_01675 [Cryptococcus amylolentus CBS 6039]
MRHAKHVKGEAVGVHRDVMRRRTREGREGELRDRGREGKSSVVRVKLSGKVLLVMLGEGRVKLGIRLRVEELLVGFRREGLWRLAVGALGTDGASELLAFHRDITEPRMRVGHPIATTDALLVLA